MDAQEIEIRIAEDGRVTFHVHGVKGKGCVSLTEAMEKALGVVESRVFMQDYYDPGDVSTSTDRTIERKA